MQAQTKIKHQITDILLLSILTDFWNLTVTAGNNIE